MGLFFVLVGTLANIAGTIPYLIGTFRGTTKPNRVTWFFWMLAPAIAAFAALSAGAQFATIPVFCSATLCFLTFIASFINPRAYWKLGVFDYLCGCFALLALILWFVTKNASTAIVFAIVSDLFASFPTMRKAWTNPETESPWTYVGGFLNGASALFVLPALTFAAVAFPIEIMFIETTVLVAMYRKRLKR